MPLAAGAHLGADTAVLVVLGVALALLTTGAANHDAGFDGRTHDADIRRGLAGDDPAGRTADVCAVEAQANATDQLGQLALAQVGVSAARADRCAVATRLDTTHAGIEIDTGRLRMQLEHLSNRHFGSFIAE
jgi:hypothetical protein